MSERLQRARARRETLNRSVSRLAWSFGAWCAVALAALIVLRLLA